MDLRKPGPLVSDRTTGPLQRITTYAHSSLPAPVSIPQLEGMFPTVVLPGELNMQNFACVKVEPIQFDDYKWVAFGIRDA